MSSYSDILKAVGKTFVDSFLSLGSDIDSGESLEKEIVNRDRKYTELLNDYISITKRRNVIKEVHKWIFFWFVTILCGVVICIVFRTVNRILAADDYSAIIQSTPIFITALASCITAVIAVPLAITNFLFNTKEDDNIASIIQHMQDHDMEGMTLLKERFIDKTSESQIEFLESDIK